MSNLQITLLGNIRITHDDWQSEVKITRSLQGLLGYLLLNRERVIPREILSEVLWGEYSQRRARNCLNTALWRLRDLLEPEGIPRGTYLISDNSGGIGINQSNNIWLDIAIFEDEACRVLNNPHHELEESIIQQLQNSMDLYQGELLEGFYEDWILREREHLRSLYINCHTFLMDYEKQNGIYKQALSHGQQILDLEPLREDIHREMMRVYTENGQRPLAVRQYKYCCRILEEELGIPPMNETKELYAEIVNKEKLNDLVSQEAQGTYIGQALDQLNTATRAINNARIQILQATKQIDNSIKDN